MPFDPKIAVESPSAGTRLRELREEQASGQAMLAELERKQAELRATLLRIGGAIQALEKLLASPEPP